MNEEYKNIPTPDQIKSYSHTAFANDIAIRLQTMASKQMHSCTIVCPPTFLIGDAYKTKHALEDKGYEVLLEGEPRYTLTIRWFYSK